DLMGTGTFASPAASRPGAGRGGEGARGRGDEGTRGRGGEGARGRGDEGADGGFGLRQAPSTWCGPATSICNPTRSAGSEDLEVLAQHGSHPGAVRIDQPPGGVGRQGEHVQIGGRNAGCEGGQAEELAE